MIQLPVRAAIPASRPISASLNGGRSPVRHTTSRPASTPSCAVMGSTTNPAWRLSTCRAPGRARSSVVGSGWPNRTGCRVWAACVYGDADANASTSPAGNASPGTGPSGPANRLPSRRAGGQVPLEHEHGRAVGEPGHGDAEQVVGDEAQVDDTSGE
jgi:hypothetical protein